MRVRMKLDVAGIKLSLAQWSRLSESERRCLFELPCDDRDKATAYGELLARLVLLRTGESVRLLEAAVAAEWDDVRVVPSRVIRRAEALGVAPPSLEQWRDPIGHQGMHRQRGLGAFDIRAKHYCNLMFGRGPL